MNKTELIAAVAEKAEISKKDAEKAVKAFTDAVAEELAKGGCLPARKDFFDNKYFEETPQYQVLKEALDVSETPYSLKYDEMYTPMLEDMQSCLNQQMTPEEAAADISARIDAIMAE